MFEVAKSLALRNDELERLIALADEKIEVNEAAYNTLCRACCVLIASHLEGFLKDLSKSLILDLNFYLKSFSNMPPAVKNTFCQKIAFYEGVKSEEINLRAKQLAAFFEENTVAVNMHAFTYKETANKNPGSDIIDGTLAKLGIPNVLLSITNPKMESIFENDLTSIYKIRRDFKRFRSRLYNFPYKKLPKSYEFVCVNGKHEGNGKTIWHTFISEVMGRRHTIAHGDTLNNEVTSARLRQDVERLDVLMHGLMYSAVSHLVKNM